MKLRSVNPHDQSIVGELEISTTSDISKAVEHAKNAFQVWRHTLIRERILYIKKFRDELEKKKETIAELITFEMGKPIRQSKDEVSGELQFLDYYIKNAPKVYSDETVYKKGSEHFRITYEPYGVCACITPWNFPLSMVTSGIIPALLAGNTVILKPSEYTSLSQKMVVDILHGTGLPEGVAQVVIGGGNIGKVLIDQNIDLVWFTGSTKIGQEIYETCGKKFIKALLEMGGSSPGIVFADADLRSTIDHLYWARFFNCGQVCTAIKRLFVEQSVFKQVVRLFIDKLKKLHIGNPTDPATDLGPIVSHKQLEFLKAQVADAVAQGATLEIGGTQSKQIDLVHGNYFEPTILTHITPHMRVLTEEVFGPVLPILPFETEEEVIQLANATEYGLSAEIYTTDMDKGERVAKRIHAGTVAINTDNFFKPECPFGGYKKSGMGREYGEIGMKEFSQTKLIAVLNPSS